MKRLRSTVFSLCKWVILTVGILASLAVTVVIAASLMLGRGTPQRPQSDLGDGALGDFRMYASHALAEAMDGVLDVKKHYWIQDGVVATPKPNPKCYGQADDPAGLGWLLKKAEPLLDGQDTLFNTDIEIIPGSQIRYYLDDTIFAISWKEGYDHGAYTFAEVKVADPSQFRRFFADNTYNSEKLFPTTEMAVSVNAVLASSGDFYKHRIGGIIVYNGKVQRTGGVALDTCYVDKNGDLLFSYAKDPMDMETAQKFVDDHDIQFSIAFGPVLMENGRRMETYTPYPVGENADMYPRAALGQRDKLHYILATVNTEYGYWNTANLYQFADRMQETGCRDIYTLDGGQTAAIAMDGTLCNNVMMGAQRRISDIIYFGTAMPYHGSEEPEE